MLKRRKSQALRLEDKLWGGFSTTALEQLRALRAREASDPEEASLAAWALARWHAVQGDFDAALAHIIAMRTILPSRRKEPRQFMLEAMFLCRLGEPAAARKLLAKRFFWKRYSAAGHLLLANTWNREPNSGKDLAHEIRVLNRINSVFRRANLEGIEKRYPNHPLGMDNLKGKSGKKRNLSKQQGARVTVIVPAFNSARTIQTALLGIAEQTWEDLEVLIIDDSSVDGTAEIVADFCSTDRRFRLIRQVVNSGSYACRNVALKESSGDFITVHDADDWSHPCRIERQATNLIKHKQAINYSYWARATDDLFFWGNWRPNENLLSPNFSSFMFRRELIDSVGMWDDVRISADREFRDRVKILTGSAAKGVLSACPLAFGRVGKQALTQTAETHASTLFHGVRREYREAFAHWHAHLKKGERLDAVSSAKAFHFSPPLSLSSDRTRPENPDLLFIGDFNLSGGTTKSAVNMMLAARRSGFSVALLQYRRFDLNPNQALAAEIRTFAIEQNIRILAPGERLSVTTVIVTYPAIFDSLMDRLAAIECRRLLVVVNQMAERDLNRANVAYCPGRVRRHLKQSFGTEGNWIPISNWVRRLMEEDSRYPAPHLENWTPLIDVEEWCAAIPQWRGNLRQRPVLGRHGRDHPLKWPGGEAALRNAYCAGRPCQLRFLGGANHARALVRRWPSNWQEMAFDSLNVFDFLRDLDCFLHFPHEDYIEEFGRAPMEAMAVGVPVVLPPVFRETFGDSAIYAEPENVWEEIERLWNDQQAWESRVAAGRLFVKENSAFTSFEKRVETIAKTSGQPAIH